ncbi:putative late blight resistance protein homolog R1B-16 isoform X1 [Nicotiana sylvestris]|uniref:Late blight resistance protein homolog R1B-16 isoform X1 n=1 Tax=Nicotiana sylvestris TaxID=4096 RepID=A0A1U7XQV3_NICSY|nr:PREDICTED: putative late blight resistance protein homolog R1B-16 isoform X1 [Nicotiana sylvestris]XP_009793284.1 PREDICTED: putative late blight resistance protein homolog R1B-16 isoform X1 [Nicotiana sylvestris]
MAAYVALTSLMGTIEQLQLLLSNLDLLDTHVESLNLLYEKVDSLHELLDNSDGEQTEDLHEKARDIANEAEDEVESQMKVVMEEQHDGLHQKEALESLFEILQRGIENVDSLKEELIKHSPNNNLQAGNSSIGDSSSPRLHAPTHENDMVGYNIEQANMLSQLTRDSPELEVISVTGMGGIGKSTFAKKLFSHPSVLSFFDIRGWVTVSEDYSYRNMLLGLLEDANIGKEEDLDKKSDSDLAVCLKQSLMGRRYLIVVDDIWSKNAWDEIRLCLPDDGKRSRVLLTTRDVEVAQYASSAKDPFRMHLLGPDDSWNLFYQKAFAEKGFPIEFEDVGKYIAKNCKGLPLMIAVVAKFLSSKRTLEEWRKVAKSLSSLADVDAYQQCSEVLALSYNHLPYYLKGCFLYFGLFPKASKISMERLKRLWIAEGLLKVKGMEGLEEVAASHLNYLIDKSLVIVSKRSMDGKIIRCMIHDLVHDFCLKEADGQNLLYFVNTNIDGPLWFIPEGCRWMSLQSRRFYFRRPFPDFGYSKLRSFSVNCKQIILDRCHFKLLRVLDMEKRKILHFPIAILELVLLRYLALRIRKPGKLPISKLLNLQTLIVRPIHTGIWGMYSLPNGIWKLSQLRHLHCWCMYLDSPQLASQNEAKNLILENLQTVYGLRPSCCTKEIFEGIKKVKKLEIAGEAQEFNSETGWHNNLKYFEELEALKVTVSLYCGFDYPPCLINPSSGSFPPNLKKLTLTRTCLPWNCMKIFSKLPNLEVLELKNRAFSGDEWEITEMGFPKLKFLLLEDLLLIYWKATDDYFQCLEHVYIRECRYLQEIPEGFADSVTLQLIELHKCCHPLVTFAKQIQEKHEELGNNMLKVYAFDSNLTPTLR